MTVPDTSALIAVLAAEDPRHEPARDALSRAWRRGGDIVIPAVACAETVVGALRAGGEPLTRADAFFGRVRVEALGREDARLAAGLRAGHPWLRMPDEFILAVGVRREAEIITGDGRWARLGDRVRVIGPAGGPSAPAGD